MWISYFTVRKEPEGRSRAFNEGCDARLAGHPLSANPYDFLTAEAKTWRDGWNHVDKYWGRDAGGKAPPLPPVR